MVGVEGEISASGVSGHIVGHPFGATDDFKSDLDWVGTVTGRLGFVSAGNALYYLKGGVAFDEYQYKLNTLNPGGNGAYPSVSDSRTGWILGLGAEYPLTTCITAKFEYNYMDFGSETIQFPMGTTSNGGPINAFSADVDQKLHTVKIGLNYRFGVNDYAPLK